MNNEHELTESAEVSPDPSLSAAPNSQLPTPHSEGTPNSELPTPHSNNPPIHQSNNPIPSRRRRNGKVAALPSAIREQINHLLQDGVPYQDIIDRLSLAPAITKHHLSEWKDGGYQDWLKDQFWQEEMRDRHQVFSGLKPGTDAVQLPEGGLQLAAIELCELLRDISELSAEHKPDPDKCVRLANALARVSRSILQLQQYRDACQKARAAMQPLKDPRRKMTDSERRAIIRHVDDILGLQSMDAEDETPNSDLNGTPAQPLTNGE